MVDRIDQRFDAVDRRFDQVDARMDRLELRMERFEAKMDAGFADIRRDMFNGMVALVVAQLGTLASIIIAAVLVG